MTNTEQRSYQPRDGERPIAPLWHTGALVLLISSVALAGTLLLGGDHPASSPPPDGRVGIYLPMLVVPWMLTFYVAWVGRAGRAQRGLGSLLGRKWDSFWRIAVDLAIGIALAIAIRLLERALAAPIDATHATAIAAMLPHTNAERAAWIVVAVSTGFGEEVVYRGYLQTQLGALTKRPIAGLVLQAVLFGVAHLQQGPAAAARVVLYGLLFGAIVRARKSLWPAIVAHVLIDASSAFV